MPPTRSALRPRNDATMSRLPLKKSDAVSSVVESTSKTNVRLSPAAIPLAAWPRPTRSEEHTSELQSPCNLVCRLLLEKKKLKYMHVQWGIYFLLNLPFDIAHDVDGIRGNVRQLKHRAMMVHLRNTTVLHHMMTNMRTS